MIRCSGSKVNNCVRELLRQLIINEHKQTILIMKNITKFCIYACVLLFFSGLFAQPTPPNGKKWEKIDAVSDEFNGSSLNGNKWAINDPQWEGRKPARFESSSIYMGITKLV